MSPPDESHSRAKLDRRVVPMFTAADSDEAIKTLLTALDHQVSKRNEELKDKLAVSDSKIAELHRIIGELTTGNGELTRRIASLETTLVDSRNSLTQLEATRSQVASERDSAQQKVLTLETQSAALKTQTESQIRSLVEKGNAEKSALQATFTQRLTDREGQVAALQAKARESNEVISTLKLEVSKSHKWQFFLGLLVTIAIVAAAVLVL